MLHKAARGHNFCHFDHLCMWWCIHNERPWTMWKLSPFRHQPCWTLIRVPIYSAIYSVVSVFVSFFFSFELECITGKGLLISFCLRFICTCTRIEPRSRRSKPMKTFHFVKINAAFFFMEWKVSSTYIRSKACCLLSTIITVTTDKSNMPRIKNGTHGCILCEALYFLGVHLIHQREAENFQTLENPFFESFCPGYNKKVDFLRFVVLNFFVHRSTMSENGFSYVFKLFRISALMGHPRKLFTDLIQSSFPVINISLSHKHANLIHFFWY